MKAAVLYGKELVKVEDVAAGPLQPGEVRIAIEASNSHYGPDRDAG